VSWFRGAAASAPGRCSPTPIRVAKRATPARDGAIDERSVREYIEETRLHAGGNPGEPAVPVLEQDPQLITQLGEIAEPRF
jgi:hypothetical protein